MVKTTLLAHFANKAEYINFAVIMADIEKALALKKHIDFATKVPVNYYEDLDIFL